MNQGILAPRLSFAAVGIATLALFASSSPLRGQPMPLGSEIQVNTYTTDDQRQSAVAYGEDGSFIVVWQSLGSAGTDTSGRSIQGQRFDASGSQEGGPFQINSSTEDSQALPDVAIGPSGEFIVVWSSDVSTGNDDSYRSIQAQRFDSVANPVGTEFQVNTYTYSGQIRPAVAMNTDGDFVVAWQSYGSAGSDEIFFSIQARRFDSLGLPLSDDFQVNVGVQGYQWKADVAFTEMDQFIIVWETIIAFDPDGNRNIIGRRFDGAGNPLTGDFQINSYSTSNQLEPAIAADGQGNLVVVWGSYGSTGSDSESFSIQGQRLAADGSFVGPQFQANTYTPSSQRFPAVAANDAGDFMVTWESFGSSGQDDSLGSIQAQFFNASGDRVGNEMQVNTFGANNQGEPAVAIADDGEVVVTWQSFGSGGSDNDGLSVQAQRFKTACLFADGFESGDASAWTSMSP